MAERSTNKLFLRVDLPSVPQADLARTAAALLRDAAERIERGDTYGGFHRSAGGDFDGAILLGNFRWSDVGCSGPEPHELDARAWEMVNEFIQPEHREAAFRNLRPHGVVPVEGGSRG